MVQRVANPRATTNCDPMATPEPPMTSRGSLASCADAPGLCRPLRGLAVGGWRALILYSNGLGNRVTGADTVGTVTGGHVLAKNGERVTG